MLVTFTKQELCDMLGVAKKTISNLPKEKLKERLYKYNYELVKDYKIGRDKVYELKILEEKTWQSIQSKYNIKDKNKHNEYSKARLTTGLKQSRKGILRELQENDVNISYDSASKYDKILLEEEVMTQDGKMYYMYNLM